MPINQSKKNYSLKSKILLLVIPAFLVIAVGLTSMNAYYINRSTRTALEKTMCETAKIAAESVSNMVGFKTTLTASIASRVGALYADDITSTYEKRDAAAFERVLDGMKDAYGFLYIFAIGADGFARTSLHTDFNSLDADYYTAIAEDGAQSFVSDVALDQESLDGKYVLNYSAPILDASGNYLGVLVCKDDAKELSDLVSGISVGERGSTFAMDASGQCIAHKNEGLLYSGAEFVEYRNGAQYASLNALWDAMASGDSGCLTYYLEGARLAAFETIGGTNNWTLAVTVSEEEFLRDASEAVSVSIIVAAALMLVISLVLVPRMRSLTNRVSRLTARLEKLAAGDLTTDVPEDGMTDEVARLTDATRRLVDELRIIIKDIEDTLSEMASGNLTVTTSGEFPGDLTEIKAALDKNISRLNEMLRNVFRTSEEIARGSAQMAQGASGLAQGATEQAGSVEELFTAVTDLAQKAVAIGGVHKLGLEDIAEEDAETEKPSATLTDTLSLAIARVSDESASIRRIAADIESISSETGMLALNASVEATHAGEAGKGFAVIAGEVRALSEKSRDAARRADKMTDNIARAVGRGTQVVEITISSIDEMTTAITQIKTTLEEISNVIESIAATAEETAAGSQELSAQADVLREMVADFKYNAE